MADRVALVIGFEIASAAINHQLGDAFFRNLVPVERGRNQSASKDRRSVADPFDLVQAMRDVDDRDSLRQKVLNDLEQQLSLCCRQSRCWLVEDYQAVSTVKQGS